MIVKIKDIKPNPNNPRVIKDEQFERLKQSIIDFPEMLRLRPIVIDENNVILGGNMRYHALLDMGETDVLCVVAEGLTEEQKKEFIIKDNVGYGEWDWNVLANEWDTEKLIDWGLEIPSYEMPSPEAEDDDYEIPDEIKTTIKYGDIIEIGRHRLMCGDSTKKDDVEKLMNGEKADMVFTSPPYNANTQIGFTKKGGVGLKTSDLYKENQLDNKTSQDYIQFNTDIFNTIKTIASNDLVILYNINYNRNSPDDYIDVVNEGRNVFNLVETIIWEKSMAISLAGDNLTRIFEFIFVFYNGNDKPKLNKTHTNECIKNLWDISNIGANNEHHKACFPVKLVEKGINVYAKENALIYEPFTGSGSTMVACHQLNRTCYGMELDPKYCQVIVDRMKKLDDSIVVKINGGEL